MRFRVRQQVLGTVQFENLPCAQDDDAIVIENRSQPMGDGDECTAGEFGSERRLDGGIEGVIETGAGFVEEEDLGLSNETSGEGNELFLTLG